MRCALFALLAFVTQTGVAGQVVGRVTAVHVAEAIIEIEGERYFVAETSAARELKNLKPGQVVRYEASDGQLTRIVVVPGLHELPH